MYSHYLWQYLLSHSLCGLKPSVECSSPAILYERSLQIYCKLLSCNEWLFILSTCAECIYLYMYVVVGICESAEALAIVNPLTALCVSTKT